MPNPIDTVVITGAGAGVGRATAQEFARRGSSIALLARGEERLRAAAGEVDRLGGRGLPIPTDVADPEQVSAAAARAEEQLGPIDVWVNNAMVTVFGRFSELTPDEFRRVTEVTYLGSVYGTMTALSRMRPRDRGVIVQVGSALAHRGIPLQAAYCGAKHGVKGYLDSVRTELMHDGSGVQISLVSMPALNTPQFDWCRSRMPRRAQPVPPIYQPEVAARAVVQAAESGRPRVRVGYATLGTIWGENLVPGLMDRYLAKNGFESQMTDEPEHDRPDNLFEPVPGGQTAHGRFDAVAKDWSPVAWLGRRKLPIAVAATAFGAWALTR